MRNRVSAATVDAMVRKVEAHLPAGKPALDSRPQARYAALEWPGIYPLLDDDVRCVLELLRGEPPAVAE